MNETAFKTNVFPTHVRANFIQFYAIFLSHKIFALRDKFGFTRFWWLIFDKNIMLGRINRVKRGFEGINSFPCTITYLTLQSVQWFAMQCGELLPLIPTGAGVVHTSCILLCLFRKQTLKMFEVF